ncbi:MAG TPA: hypothetical protein VKQ71_00700, partial [Acidimicrobiales bacterium]|nr:hypothetical protein [Acidimicrobiales bacterium]
TELVSLGVFGISEVDIEDDGEQFLLTVNGYDRSRTVARRAWTDVYTVPAGLTYDVAIRNLIESRFPNGSGWTYNFAPQSAVTPSSPLYTFANQGSNNDPWAAATTLATACGCLLYFDVLGNLVLAPAASGVGQQPLMTYGTGAGVVKAKRMLVNEGVYNDVVVIASGTSVGTPVRGQFQDTNTGSPTYVNGPYGDVPQVVNTSTVTTAQAAATMAAALMQLAAGLSDTVQADIIPNAALDIGTVVTLSRSRMNMAGNYVVTAFDMPLESGTAQTVKFRRQQATS